MYLEHQVGLITPAIIEAGTIDAWAASWLDRARKAQRDSKELVVLEVPKNELIEAQELDVELYLRLNLG